MRIGQPNQVHCPFPLEWKDQAMNTGVLEGVSTEVEAKSKGRTACCTLCSQAVVKRKKVGLRGIQICVTTLLSLDSNSEYFICILK